MKKVILLFFIFQPAFAISQVTEIAKLYVTTGNSIDFYFNNISELTNPNGITLNTWTIFNIRVSILDGVTPRAGTNWDFVVNKTNATIDGSSTSLPDNIIAIRAVYHDKGGGTQDSGIRFLTGVNEVILFDDIAENEVDSTIDIYYHCGNTSIGCSSVQGNEDDYYFCPLKFELRVNW